MAQSTTEQPPKILYKYLDPKGVVALTSLTLRFTRLLELNDPFESRMPILLQPSSDLAGNPARKVVFPKLRPDQLEETLSQYGVSCFSQEPDNLLMWSHYGCSHSGLVIGFKTEHPSFRECGDLIRVAYRHNRPKFRSRKKAVMLKAISTKSRDWKYEKEWRIATPLSSCKSRGGVSVKCIEPECISEVILGVAVGKELIDKVVKWQAKNSHVTLRRNRLDSFRYRLYRDENVREEPALVVSEDDLGGPSETHVGINFGEQFAVGILEFNKGTMLFRDITEPVIEEARKPRKKKRK